MNKNLNQFFMIHSKRIAAFVIDTSLFISVFTTLLMIFNKTVPETNVRLSPMQLFTQKDFTVFTSTVSAALLSLIIYLLCCYFTSTGQTVGQRLVKIKIIPLRGHLLGALWRLRVLSQAIIRFLLIFTPGPFAAAIGGSLGLSIFLLIWGGLIILPIPIKREPQILTLWQIIGNYQFVSADKKN